MDSVGAGEGVNNREGEGEGSRSNDYRRDSVGPDILTEDDLTVDAS